jgi:fibronectin-binding autotransporter adhesin
MARREQARRSGRSRQGLTAVVAAAVAAGGLTVGHARADGGSAAWVASPTNPNWVPGAGETNWSTGPGMFPGSTTGTANADVATFNVASSQTSITINSPSLNVGSILFDGSASAYTIGTDAAPLLLSAGGSITAAATLANTNGTVQRVAAPLTLLGNYSFLSNTVAAGNLNDSLSITGGVTAGTAAATTLTLGGTSVNAANTVSGDVADGSAGGSVAVAKTGAGVWALSGNNTYTGATAVNVGTLIAGSNSALGAAGGSVVVANAAGLSLANGVTITGKTITLTGNGNGSNGALTTVSGASATWAGNVILGATLARLGTNGNGTLTVTGVVDDGPATLDLAISAALGTVQLNGVNTYGGKTQLVRGTLKIGVNDSLPTGTTLDVHALATPDPAAFDLNGFNQTVAGLTRSDTSGTGTVTNSSATPATFTVNSAAAFTFSGQVRGTALSFVKDGAGTLILSGTNDYGGTTLVSGGTLQIGAGGTSGTFGAGAVTTNATLAFSRSDAVAIAANLGGTGGVSQIGPGTLTLSGTNTYAGGTAVNGGVLVFASPAAVPSAGLVTVNAAGGLAPGGAFGTVSALLGSGKVAAASTGAVLLTADSGEAINFTGYPSLRLGATGAFTYSGPLTPADGTTYQLGGGGGTLTFAPSITGASAVVVGAAGSAGTVVLTGANTYAGVTTVNGGFLTVPSSAALGSAAGGTVINSNAAGNVGGAVVFQGGVTVADAFTLNGGGDGNGAFRNAAGSNTITGTVTVGNVTTNNRIASDAGTLTLAGNVSIPFAGRALVLQGNGNGVISGNISGAGNLIRSTTGTGTWTLTGVNTYTGTTTVSGGVLALGNANALSPSTVLGGGGGVLDLRGFNQQVAGLNGTNGLVIASSSTTADTVLTVDTTPGATSFGGSLRDATGAGTRKLSLVKQGANALTLTGINTYTGGTTVLGGTLTEDFSLLPTATASGNQAVANNLAAGSALTLGGGTFTLAGRANSTLTSLAGTTFATGSNAVTVTSTTNLVPGQIVTGTGIPANAYVVGVTSATTFTLSANTTAASGTGSYTLSANTATTSQAFAGLTLLTGASAVTSTAAPATLALNAISRPIGATVNFAPGAASTFTTTTPNAFPAGGQQTILGGYATFGGTTWAVSGSGATAGTITGLPTASYYSTDFAAGAAGKDVDLPAAAATSVALTVNSLRFNAAAASTLTVNQPLVVASGGILATPTNANGVTITGAGTITSGNGSDLIVFTNQGGGNFVLNTPVVDADAGATPIGVTKSGSGQYVVGIKTHTYSGPTYLNSGAIIPQFNSVGPAGSPTSGPFGRGTFVFNGGNVRATTTPETTVSIIANPVLLRADTTFITSGTTTSDKALAFTGPVTLSSPTGAAGVSRTISITSGADAIFAGAIGDGGLGLGLVKAGTSAGRLVLTGANTYTGGTTVIGGTLAGTTLGLQGNILATAGTVVFDQTLPTLTGGSALPLGTYAGVISGAGAVTKANAGTVSLTGTSTYTGATTITGGTLAVNGALSATSGVTVQAGGTVGGIGSIAAPLTVASGGLLSPGNSAGTLTTGSLTLASGSTLVEEITSASSYDRVAASAVNAASAGSNLQVALGYIPSATDAFVILTNGGAAATPKVFDNVVTPNGTFALADNGNGTYTATDPSNGTYTLTYGFNADGGAVGNDVLLTTTAVPEPAAAGVLGLAAAGLLATRHRRRDGRRLAFPCTAGRPTGR